MSLTHAPQQAQSQAADPQAAAAPEHAPARPAPVAGIMVGAADDRAEHEADALADVALRRLRADAAPEATPEGAPRDAHTHDPGCGHLRRLATPSGGSGATSGAVVGAAGGALDDATSAQIAARTGAGRGLPDGLRRSMEGAFGTGLAHVRIHDDSAAASLNRSVSARAFTTGSDIFFGAGEYAPDKPLGQRVLAHELAHVVSEGGSAPVRRWDWKPSFLMSDQEKKDKQDRDEAEAKTKQEKKDKKTKDNETESRHKALEKTTGAAYKEQRKVGVAARQGMSETMRDGTFDEVGRAKALLDEQQAEAAESERELAVELARKNPTWSEDQIVDEAYQQTWVVGFRAKNLYHVRPPRETAAERLVSQIRESRGVAGAAQTVNDATASATKLGTMLPKEVELTYEKYVTALQTAMAATPAPSLEDATALAETQVWGSASAKAKKYRPAPGSALDTRALLDARTRLAAGPREEVSGLDKADALSDKVGGYVDKGEGALGHVQSAISDAGQKKDTKLDADNTGDPAYTKDPSGVGATVFAAREAAENVKTGNRSGEGPEYPKSVETKVAEGMSTVTGVFTSLTASVDGVIKFVKALKESQKAKNPRKDLAAAKAGFDGLNKLTEAAKSTAQLAVLIDSSVESNVKKVIPGLNIVTAVLSVASNAMTLAEKSMRMNETNTALLEARLSDPDVKRVNVLVHPLLRVASKFTKNLEQASWSTAVAISEVVTSIATVASGGGFGIPTAVQTGIGALDKLHSLGHFIADEYLTYLSEKAKDASAGALEGSAEQLLANNPGMAVDGIILRAAGGDPQALAFLMNYEVDGEPVDALMIAKVHRRSAKDALLAPTGTAAAPPPAPAQQDVLFKIREAVLAEMGDAADPEYTYVTWKNKVGSAITAVSDKWTNTGSMADKRNRMDTVNENPEGGQRGTLWRLKMMFQTEKKRGRSTKKTEVNWEDAEAKHQVRGEGVLVVCGPLTLTEGATTADLTDFSAKVDQLPDAVVVAAATNPDNDPAWRDFLLKIVQERLKKPTAHTTTRATATP